MTRELNARWLRRQVGKKIKLRDKEDPTVIRVFECRGVRWRAFAPIEGYDYFTEGAIIKYYERAKSENRGGKKGAGIIKGRR